LKYDVIIIGAGPAGLFAAKELSKKKLHILVIDRGKSIEERNCPMLREGKCLNCNPCDIMSGLGGAGAFSDGTLNVHPQIGGDLTQFLAKDDAWDLVEEVDQLFAEYWDFPKATTASEEEINQLKRRAASCGAHFIDIKQRHIGSDHTHAVIANIKKDLENQNVKFLLNTEIDDILIKNKKCAGVIKKASEHIQSNYVLLAPGRIGADWVGQLVKKHNIEAKFSPIDLGVRVEVLSIIMESVIKINRDPKFYIRTSYYDDLMRTFCTNYNGYVVRENYNSFIGVNGHSLREKKSENTNFAFIMRLELTKPQENTIQYGQSIAHMATTIGGGLPIIQRLGDLRRGRRSTPERIRRNPVNNTLKEATPGDISMALPHRLVKNIIEGLEILDNIIPGVAVDSTLLYAPEIKFYSLRLATSENMESSIPHLFLAGDGVGLSRGLVTAAATGLLAARGILKNLNLHHSFNT
jgi:uncharacterized FAD-dependent dehydrogenase